MKILVEMLIVILLLSGVITLWANIAKSKLEQTQPAIQTVIVSVRGCDVIQHIQGDRLIAAHNAADQPKTCKVMK